MGKFLAHLNKCLCIDLASIEKYKYHQSIISINEKMREKNHPHLSFRFVSLEETIKEL